MKLFNNLLPVLTAGVLALAAAGASAQPQRDAPAAPAHTWTTEQAVTSSVREAWALGGKTPEGFFEIVRALAEISAQKRGITLPDKADSGAKAGDWIKQQAKNDPDQLLYVIVDRAVRQSAGRTAGN